MIFEIFEQETRIIERCFFFRKRSVPQLHQKVKEMMANEMKITSSYLLYLLEIASLIFLYIHLINFSLGQSGLIENQFDDFTHKTKFIIF